MAYRFYSVTCVTQNTFAKFHRASVFAKSILMFSMYVCAVNNSLLPPLCIYVFFSALLAPLKPSFQIFSYMDLERKIVLLVKFYMEIQISSLNVRGMGDKQKRSEIFNWLRSKNFSLYLLQEVHCSNDKISIWSSEWGFKSLFSCCSSAKGGVAILFNNNFSFKILLIYEFGHKWQIHYL